MRTSARKAGAVAAAAAIALLLGGCGSGDDGSKGAKDEGGGGKPKASASESASASAEKPDQPSGDASEDAPEGAPDDSKSGKLTGIWKAKGKQYVLTFVGGKVTLLRERGRNCTGDLSGADARTLALKCPDGGNQTRTNGTVGSVKKKSVVVSWKGGPTETYARVTDVPVKLPESPKS